LNQYDCVHRVILADGVTSFETAVYDPGPRWPEAWTSGAALASRRGGALLTGHPVQIGDLIQITGALPTGQIKAHCLIWDVAYDLVVFDIKKELRSWNSQVYFSVLNELHASPANLDVQTASNLDLAKVRDQKLMGARRSRRERERLTDSDITHARLYYASLARNPSQIPLLPSESEIRYDVPVSGPAQMVYRGLPLDEVEDLLPQSAAYRQASRILFAEPTSISGRPLTPLHSGHMAC